jgi:hypothetical protein
MRVVYADRCAARLPGLLERDARRPQWFVQWAGRVQHFAAVAGHPETDAHGQRHALDVERVGQHVGDVLGHLLRLGVAGEVVEQDDEVAAPDVCGEVGFVDERGQSAAHGPEHLVAHACAERVVDGRHLTDGHLDHREPPAGLCGAQLGDVQLLLEHDPVGQSGARAGAARVVQQLPQRVVLDGHRGEVTGVVQQRQLVGRGFAWLGEVDREGAQHPVGEAQERRRPAGDEAVWLGGRAPFVPRGVERDVSRDHDALVVGGGAAGAGARADQGAFDRGVVLGRQRRAGADPDPEALFVEQQDRGERTGDLPLDDRGDERQDLGQRRVLHDEVEDLAVSDEPARRARRAIDRPARRGPRAVFHGDLRWLGTNIR